ncbi:imidazole glycerol phosphate synthase subunit HisH [Raineya orbicola]|jgi:glutamine amidotransferase|uniref:Imidazole glycerol phosphate synthase subunit HisH n=1 Tax=Raineya orbicola TaxID=2016530 RepID=A0A2N3IKI4_9BACT|nr:imidazole glycerol phosphate synthase subunit HisH [Raineya orbicola]PKQ70840.1 Imidazole glycerol phosphate synthase, glutamine amidotransferase subunit [Raineya orbicola]
MKYKNIQVAIIDYDLGNTYSVLNAIEFLGYKVFVTSEYEKLKKANAIILPGVGAFEAAIKSIVRKELDKILTELVLQEQKPLLGICLGMQLLANTSEENGLHQGLGFIEGNVKKITPKSKAAVPHVGWNDLNIIQNSKIYSRLKDSKNFYFDHSYHFECESQYISATCNYGGLSLVASVQKNNIFGVQFHPEKSQNNGLRLFRAFIENS